MYQPESNVLYNSLLDFRFYTLRISNGYINLYWKYQHLKENLVRNILSLNKHGYKKSDFSLRASKCFRTRSVLCVYQGCLLGGAYPLQMRYGFWWFLWYSYEAFFEIKSKKTKGLFLNLLGVKWNCSKKCYSSSIYTVHKNSK